MVNREQQLQVLVDGKKIVVTEASVRRDLQLDDEEGTDCLPNATIFEELTRMGFEKLSQKLTFYKAFFSPQWNFLIHSVFAMPKRPKEKDTQVPQSSVPSDPINVTDEAVNEEPSMKLKELMDFYTKLQQKVLDLENTKTAQAQEITNMFGVHDLDGDEVVVESKVFAKKKHDEVNVAEEVVSAAEEIINAATITEDGITLAQALAKLKSVKPKDKGKGIMVKEPLMMKKKDQINFDEQEAIRLQAEFEEEARLITEKDEANVALIEEWNDIQANIDVDYQIAKQMQAEE
ncbi:hypothetical protein Tco_0122905 [Tanacetum coccineum]